MRRLIALLLLISLVCTMVSCEGFSNRTDGGSSAENTANADDQQKPNTQEPLVVADRSKTDYTVVYSADGDSALQDTLNLLQNRFYKSTGASISCCNDTYEETPYEILIGNTRRAESILETPLEKDEILIRVIGKKIVIQTGCDAFMTNAVECFMESLVEKNDVTTLPASFDLKVRASFAHFKVATFNIHNGMDVNYNFELLARDIVQSGASVIALQEIDQLTERNRHQDTLKILSEYTGFPYYAYHATLPNFLGGEYGIAVLSKYPIASFEGEWLPRNGNEEQRAALKTVIDVGGTSLSFISTHCGGARIEQELSAIRNMLTSGETYAVGGDFNAQDYAKFAVFENAALANSAKKPLITTQNGKKIDNIICSSDLEINSAKAINTGHSDHFLVVAEVTLYLR